MSGRDAAMDQTADLPVAQVRRRSRARDHGSPEAILAVATREFSEKGFHGARMDKIAADSGLSNRLLYYYYTNKLGLYRAVLRHCLTQADQMQEALELDQMSASQALRTLVAATCDFYRKNTDVVRLLMSENLERARHMRAIGKSRGVHRTELARLSDLVARGKASGEFRADLDALGLHLTIVALGSHFVANQHTIARLLDVDSGSSSFVATRRAEAIEMVCLFCAARDRSLACGTAA